MNSEQWHFALMVRPPGHTGQLLAIEHVVDHTDKCMVYSETREADLNEGNLALSAPLKTPNGESDDMELHVAVTEITEGIKSASQAKIATGDFKNCLDFVSTAVGKLQKKGFLSSADAKKFTDFCAARRAYVKAWTDHVTQQACARGVNGCKSKGGKGGK